MKIKKHQKSLNEGRHHGEHHIVYPSYDIPQILINPYNSYRIGNVNPMPIQEQGKFWIGINTSPIFEWGGGVEMYPSTGPSFNNVLGGGTQTNWINYVGGVLLIAGMGFLLIVVVLV